ncbi:alkaline phosphatase D family protein [Saccharopolyspora mangrovi]|uniref:Alkaline phosphatase D family protein n=1 Tax=Saccharopolyspora mangrovi TaxID=3082379 RepID=A0ABU6AK85_9PSEU|nr:alkaline phosphatase D family protein [Saccharopolyspora sp. S2-29]MEB3371867.1 alkaline phosphatase D family protein [Saccharopolyspora sp. S2-29]
MSLIRRRSLIKAGGVLAGAMSIGGPTAAASGPVFAHGIASGDPTPDGVVLWTRVTPGPDALPGSGAGPDCAVDWEVAADEGFSTVLARGTATTGAWRDHTVKVDLAGLPARRWLWYRFRALGEVSRVGRTRTAPAADAPLQRLRVGVVSCSNWQAGHFAAYRHLAARGDLDAVLHLGDYLYEYAPGEYQARDVVVRPHDPPVEMTRLEHYRRRHAQYKTDPDLAELHASVPFVVTWDDHESANDAWSGGAENHTEGTEGAWSDRRSASQRAYAEWMPVRYEPGGSLHRRLRFGSLAELSMLDLRSHRSQQVSTPLDPGISDPARTITGDEQMRWLTGGLAHCTAQWKLVGNPVMIAPVRFPSTLSVEERRAIGELTGTPEVQGLPYNVDQWDGYTADREEIFALLRENGITDTVFLTGDIHSAWAAELPASPASYPLEGGSVGTELVCTSVTSDNLDDILRVPPRTASLSVEGAIRANNPHVKHLDFDSHGFSVLDVTPERVQMDWFALADRTAPGSGAQRSASFAVPAGTQQVHQVSEGIR